MAGELLPMAPYASAVVVVGTRGGGLVGPHGNDLLIRNAACAASFVSAQDTVTTSLPLARLASM